MNFRLLYVLTCTFVQFPSPALAAHEHHRVSPPLAVATPANPSGVKRAAVSSLMAAKRRPPTLALVRVQTKAGMITVDSRYADRFRGFIDALPYTPRRVTCFAAHGHVRHSLHHIGGACDIDQRGRNRTSAAMYHVAALASRFGLRDGCSFHDCGHVDIGVPLPRPDPRRFARASR